MHDQPPTSRKVLSYTANFLAAEEGGYTVIVPALDGCVTEGETFEEAERNAEEAITLYLESLKCRSLPLPDDTKTVVARVTVQIA